MRKALRLITAGCLLALAACTASIDVGESHICRAVLPALVAPDATARILRLAGNPDRIRIDYALAPDDGHAHFLLCSFTARAGSDGTPDLVAVATERGEMGDASLFFLKRFWLATPDGQAADPLPMRGFAHAPQVSEATAVALQQAVAALPLIAIYTLLATAFALVYGLIGRINLAFGEFAAIGGYAALYGVVWTSGASPVFTLVVCALIGASAALFHGIAVARMVFLPLAQARSQHLLVATVGLSLFLQEYLRLTQGSDMRWAGPLLNEPIALARGPAFVATVTPIALVVTGLALATAFCLLLALRLTRFGRAWRAWADDPLAAALMGIDARHVFTVTFAIASACAGLSGYAMTMFYGGVGYGASTTLGLKALIAALVGGIGSVAGGLIGGIFLGVFEAAWSAVLPVAWRDTAVYCLLAALLILRPGGFLGRNETTTPKADR